MGLVCTHVVLEVFSYVWIIDFAFDAGGSKNIWISYPGKLEKLGRLHAPGADDNFSLCRDDMFFLTMYESNALCNPFALGLFEHYFLNSRFTEQHQVWSPRVGSVVRSSRVAPFSRLWSNARK